MSWGADFARLARGCLPGWKLTRAVSEGLNPQVGWHIARCERCCLEYQALRQLTIEADATFPVPETLARDSRKAIASRLQATATLPSQRRRGRISLRVVAPIAAVLVILASWALRRAFVWRSGSRTETPSESRATIRAIGEARFTRAQLPPDEIVSLEEGAIELNVAPLHVNERFRVLTGDGKVEVRGTSFKVSASNHRLVAVDVWRGRVEVTSRGGALAVLNDGDGWVRDIAKAVPASGATTAPAPEAPSSSTRSQNTGRATAAPTRPSRRLRRKTANAALAVRPAPFNSSPARPRTDQNLGDAPSFGHAWSLLRQGDAKRAAAEFEEIERLDHGRDIEEDALYWGAVAKGRLGDAAGARRLWSEFLDRFPKSSRAGAASVSLGWLLLDSGETAAAQRAFERAALDPSPRARANAREGLRRTRGEDP